MLRKQYPHRTGKHVHGRGTHVGHHADQGIMTHQPILRLMNATRHEILLNEDLDNRLVGRHGEVSEGGSASMNDNPLLQVRLMDEHMVVSQPRRRLHERQYNEHNKEVMLMFMVGGLMASKMVRVGG